MATKVVMEALSPTMEEGRVVKWLKQEGDSVSAGETLAEVETDKAIMELVARGDGILGKIVAPEGTTLEVGELVGIIAAADEDISSLVSDSGNGAQPDAAPPADTKTAEPAAATPAAPAAPTPTAAPAGPVKASPLARRMAQEKGIDLQAVAGSGPSGRIIKRDIESFTPSAGSALPALDGPEFTDVPLTQIRKTIARRLVESIGPIPHFFLTADVDMERAAEARQQLNALGDGAKISFNDIVIKVVAEALTRHPACNAWWQGDHIRYFSEAHISVAVAVEDGLITPVVRSANRKSLRHIAQEVRDLAGRAREKRLAPEEYTGGTFSVSNLGMFGIDQFTGVINPPESGLLAVGAITEQPVVLDGAVTVRKRMKITMSCDHRTIDGATGAAFLQTVRTMLENPLAIVW